MKSKIQSVRVERIEFEDGTNYDVVASVNDGPPILIDQHDAAWCDENGESAIVKATKQANGLVGKDVEYGEHSIRLTPQGEIVHRTK